LEFFSNRGSAARQHCNSHRVFWSMEHCKSLREMHATPKKCRRIYSILAVDPNKIPCASKKEAGAKQIRLARSKAFSITKCVAHTAISTCSSFAFLPCSRNAKRQSLFNIASSYTAKSQKKKSDSGARTQSHLFGTWSLESMLVNVAVSYPFPTTKLAT
jgi:hypothetical protein